MIGDIISHFKIAGGLTCKRRAKGTYTNGIYDARGALTTITLDPIAEHPASGKDLQRLPEGFRASDVRAFYTTVLLRTSEQDEYEADVIVEGSTLWEVQHVEDWSERGGFYRVVAVRSRAVVEP